MNNFQLITIIFVVILLITGYFIYQLERSCKIDRIIHKWINNRSLKRFVHSHSTMMKPSKLNWYTFKYPNIEDYNMKR